MSKINTRQLILPLLIAFSSANAQPVSPRSPEEVDQIMEAVERNVLSSKKDKSIIPMSVYYSAIFAQMQASYPRDIPTTDARLINELPSHSNAQFAKQNVDELNRICNEAPGIANAAQALALAERFETSKKRKDKLLDAHYASFIQKLSPQTQTYIRSELVRLSETDEIGYAEVDMRAIALEVPELFIDMMKRGCARFVAMGGADLKADSRLIEGKPDIAPLGASSVERDQ